LTSLAKLPSLEVLLIGESSVTQDGMNSIRKTLPNIKFSEET